MSTRRSMRFGCTLCFLLGLTAPAAAAAGTAGDVLAEFGRDLKGLGSTESLLWLGGGSLATWGVTGIEDADGARRALDHGFQVTLSDLGNTWGGARVQVPLAVGLWAAGNRCQDDRLAATGFDLARGLVWTHAVAGGLKHAVDRTRPNGGHLSFPSGHTASAFTVAGVVSRRYGGWRSAACLGLGVLTGMGRMKDGVHHASDVVAGATLGWIVGRGVARRQAAEATAWRLVPLERGLAVAARF